MKIVWTSKLPRLVSNSTENYIYLLWFNSRFVFFFQVLDLYELYNLVTARGGLVEVINKKQWQEIIKGLNLPSSITSAAFTLRTQWVDGIFFHKELIPIYTLVSLVG